GGDKDGKLKDLVLHSVQRAYPEQKGKNEKAGRVPDDVIPNQYGGDDAGSELSAGNLKGDKKRSKRKNNKAQCRCDDHVEHRLGPGLPEVKETPTEPDVCAV